MKIRMPLWGKILLGMLLGILWGIAAVYFNWEQFTLDWIKPWGTIFLNLLKLVAVPLIFVSLIKGISSLTDISRLSRIGLKTVSIYLVTTVFAISIGLLLVNIIKPGNTFPEEKKTYYQEKFSGTIKEKENLAAEHKESSPIQFLVDMVPENIIKASSDNSKMLQIIFFAIIFGIAIVLVPQEKTKTVRKFFEGLNDIILKIIDIVMLFAPYGVFALLAALIVDFSGDMDLFTALGLYAFNVTLGLFTMILIVYPMLMRLFVKIRIKDFLKAILPAQMVAFTTSSSAATLPVTKEQCEKTLKLPDEITSFVLPVGVTINMDGTSCYQAIATVFIAQVFGYDLSFTQQLTIILTATLASIGTPGVPGGSVVMLIIVLTSVGLPIEGLALILGIDRPLDMLRTVVNITGDSTVAAIIAKSEADNNSKI